MVDGHIIELYLLATVRAVAIIFVVYVATVHSYLILPFYATQASWELVALSSVMRHASATYPVPWAVLRTGAIDVIMRAHGVIEMQKHK